MLKAAWVKHSQIISQSLKTRIIQNTKTVFFAEILQGATGFFINLMLVRSLSVESYGLFSLFVAALMTGAGFFHLGWTESLARYGARFFHTALFPSVEKFFLITIGVTLILTFTLTYLGAQSIAGSIYNRPDFTFYIQIALIGALFTSLFNCYLSHLRSKSDFQNYFRIQAGSSVLRFMLCGFLVWFDGGRFETIIWVYFGVPAFYVFLLAFRGRKTFFQKILPAPDIDSALKTEIVSYQSWIFVSFITVYLIGHIDSHFLAHFHKNETLAVFGMVTRFTLPIQFLLNALTTTFLPRLSASRDESEFRLYLSRLKYFFLPAGLFLVLFYIWGPYLLTAVAGESYQNPDVWALIRLQILTLSVPVFANPLGLVLYAWGMSKGFAYLNLFQLLLDIYLDWLWIPEEGAIGAVRATFWVNIMGLIYIVGCLVWWLSRRKQV